MRAKGIFAAALAGGLLLLTPGFEGARADGKQGHRHGHQQAYENKGHGYGPVGRHHLGRSGDKGQAYGKRARYHLGAGLDRHERKRIHRLRQRFDDERAFRRHLRHHNPGLFARYMNQKHRYSHGHRHFDGHRHFRGHRHYKGHPHFKGHRHVYRHRHWHIDRHREVGRHDPVWQLTYTLRSE